MKKTRPRLCSIIALYIALLIIATGGCAHRRPGLKVTGVDQLMMPGTIWDTAGKQSITHGQLISRLEKTRIIYVGESHTNPDHHAIQLKIIRSLTGKGAEISVGMEMFAATYQHRLDRWAAGQWDWPEFLRQVHWYANWRYDDHLYKDILLFIQSQRLNLVGLNIPFWLPGRISSGGLESLLDWQRALLPENIDTTNATHRAYVESIFKMHRIKGRDDFEFFYQAQCAWEDGMAQKIAEYLNDTQMIVLVGKGHIVRKFGIPNRAYERTRAPFATIYLAVPNETIDPADADFIWVTKPVSKKTAMPMNH